MSFCTIHNNYKSTLSFRLVFFDDFLLPLIFASIMLLTIILLLTILTINNVYFLNLSKFSKHSSILKFKHLIDIIVIN